MLVLVACSGCSIFSIFGAGGTSQDPEVAALQKQYGIGASVSESARGSYRSDPAAVEKQLGRTRAYIGALLWPIKCARLTSRFGRRSLRFHEGIDLAAPAGTPIYAAHNGDVLYSGRGFNGYGNIILLKGDTGLLSVYAHNRSNLVKKGQPVKKGQVIAYVGQTGRASGPHLHYELRVQNKENKFPAVDPLIFYPRG